MMARAGRSDDNGLPDRIGPYRIGRRLGEGGMGKVHLATDASGREVAIKVLKAHVAGDKGARRRLEREVQSMRRVHSRHIAEILDADVNGDLPYVVTQFISGPTLEDAVQDTGPLKGDELVRVAAGLARALDAIHSADVVHRDIKPGNVILSDGEAVLIDFGIAHIVDATRLTQTGTFVGTPGYLAPEVIEGTDEVGQAGDIHAWAATVAYAAQGESPFGVGRFETIFNRILTSKFNLFGVPSNLEPIVRASLSRDPAARPTTGDLLRELAALGGGARSAPAAAHGSARFPTGADFPTAGAAGAAAGVAGAAGIAAAGAAGMAAAGAAGTAAAAGAAKAAEPMWPGAAAPSGPSASAAEPRWPGAAPPAPARSEPAAEAPDEPTLAVRPQAGPDATVALPPSGTAVIPPHRGELGGPESTTTAMQPSDDPGPADQGSGPQRGFPTSGGSPYQTYTINPEDYADILTPVGQERSSRPSSSYSGETTSIAPAPDQTSVGDYGTHGGDDEGDDSETSSGLLSRIPVLKDRVGRPVLAGWLLAMLVGLTLMLPAVGFLIALGVSVVSRALHNPKGEIQAAAYQRRYGGYPPPSSSGSDRLTRILTLPWALLVAVARTLITAFVLFLVFLLVTWIGGVFIFNETNPDRLGGFILTFVVIGLFLEPGARPVRSSVSNLLTRVTPKSTSRWITGAVVGLLAVFLITFGIDQAPVWSPMTAPSAMFAGGEEEPDPQRPAEEQREEEPPAEEEQPPAGDGQGGDGGGLLDPLLGPIQDQVEQWVPFLGGN
ncbi:serine/threonine-protein kinase [Allonocardiopsis opalescens]|uniref:Serine/threonine protein kinase n=1 Tax=Allonocardiopsis opalescens TaxID=1144618 RepID=A0A2T0QDU3_9ACTN|nr:serine/threonine-protein kinase [Allonocardiopsis opalescens]PRY02114.1 serine/threonine protein kinase [Allonocardiopsis opalescens]